MQIIVLFGVGDGHDEFLAVESLVVGGDVSDRKTLLVGPEVPKVDALRVRANDQVRAIRDHQDGAFVIQFLLRENLGSSHMTLQNLRLVLDASSEEIDTHSFGNVEFLDT